jgi:hypothetical protein
LNTVANDSNGLRYEICNSQQKVSFLRSRAMLYPSIRWAARSGLFQSTTHMKQIAIFASGAGSNARKIIEHSLLSTSSKGGGANAAFKVALIVSNKPHAGVLLIAEEYEIPTLLIEKEQFFRGNAYVDELKAIGIDFIVLAGFYGKFQ